MLFIMYIYAASGIFLFFVHALVLAFVGIEQSFRRQITSFHVILIVPVVRERGGDIVANKKDLIIAILATFCMTVALFMILPTRSQQSGYDPWVDVNGDGSIDMADLSIGIDKFMTSGAPTHPLPAPAYDSGWVEIDNRGGAYVLTHNLDTTEVLIYTYSNTSEWTSLYYRPSQGHIWWCGLTDTTIWVYATPYGTYEPGKDHFRVLMWKIAHP
jgi:hypothetical protein